LSDGIDKRYKSAGEVSQEIMLQGVLLQSGPYLLNKRKRQNMPQFLSAILAGEVSNYEKKRDQQVATGEEVILL
jgi:hypothetical protein